jgi:hypothetical protein
MKYEYRIIPFIGKIKNNEGASVAAKQLQLVINQNVNAGWEFVQLGDVNIEVQPGCLDGFFGKKASYITFDQIIFKRPIEEDSPPVIS